MDYVELGAKHVIGKKEYRCEWCPEPILKSEKHLSRRYVLEGECRTGRMHLECEKAFEGFAEECYKNDDEVTWDNSSFKRGTMEQRNG